MHVPSTKINVTHTLHYIQRSTPSVHSLVVRTTLQLTPSPLTPSHPHRLFPLVVAQHETCQLLLSGVRGGGSLEADLVGREGHLVAGVGVPFVVRHPQLVVSGVCKDQLDSGARGGRGGNHYVRHNIWFIQRTAPAKGDYNSRKSYQLYSNTLQNGCSICLYMYVHSCRSGKGQLV